MVQERFRFVSFLFILMSRQKDAAWTQITLRTLGGFHSRCLVLLVRSDQSLMDLSAGDLEIAQYSASVLAGRNLVKTLMESGKRFRHL